MNKARSGLTKTPFAALPTGGDVFIGPQAADLLQSFKSGLAPPDAIVTVAGPAGAGKTTLVNYALNVIAAKKKVVRVDRESLAAKDLLETLLIELGVKNRPPEAKRRFAIFRNALQQYESAGHSVFIVVEDIGESGAAILAELATLTASGAGESSGARLVLMGKEDVEETMDNAQLAHLRQRIAHSHVISPMSDVETRGYLAHCFRAADGDFTQIFEKGAAKLTHNLCDGNPLAINRLIDAVLCAAAEQGIEPITVRFIAEIAAHDYDPEAHVFKFAVAELPVKPGAEASSANDQEQKIVEDIANAGSLDDFDDAMAETLFGPEIDLFAIPTPRKG